MLIWSIITFYLLVLKNCDGFQRVQLEREVVHELTTSKLNEAQASASSLQHSHDSTEATCSSRITSTPPPPPPPHHHHVEKYDSHHIGAISIKIDEGTNEGQDTSTEEASQSRGKSRITAGTSPGGSHPDHGKSPTISPSSDLLESQEIGQGNVGCGICLLEIKISEEGRYKSPCGHDEFHKSCIDKWSINHDTCPICRTSLTKTLTNNEIQHQSFRFELVHEITQRFSSLLRHSLIQSGRPIARFITCLIEYTAATAFAALFFYLLFLLAKVIYKSID